MTAARPRDPEARRKAALGVFFFLSGATGLVYEVLWSRHLQLLFGSTTESVSVVLATFMTGLGLGAWFFGARVDLARSPLALYALLEIGIGAWALLTGPLLALAASVYDRLAGEDALLSAGGTLVKIALAAAVLVPPAFLMGGTLPALVRAVSRDAEDARRTIGLLYGLNTLGAVAGTGTTGFVLLERLGVSRSMRIAAAVNVVLGLAVLLTRRLLERERAHEAGASPGPRGRGVWAAALSTRAGRYALAGLFVSGATTMLYEVVFTRVLGLVFGVSTYAFTLILAVFLAGLAVGALLQGALARRFPTNVSQFAFTQLAVAFLGGVAAAAIPLASRWVIVVRQTREPGFGETLALKAAVASALVLPLAIVAGLSVPLLLAVLADDAKRLGGTVGDAYLVNTAGTVVGSLLTGFLLVPLAGTHGTLRVAGAVSALAGAAGLLVATPRRRIVLAGALAAAAALLAVVLPPAWRTSLFLVSDSGRFPPAASRADVERTVRAASHEVLFFREGRTATVAAVRTTGARSLFVSGHPDASDALDMSTQVFLGVIPLVAHRRPEDVMVVGFGSGVTAEIVARLPEVRRLEVVEIEREVIRAAPFFHHVNGSVETSPKVRLVVDDARSHVRRTRRRYDLIVSEPSNPWRAGVANVFTADFFRSARGVLKPGGIFAQWVQLYAFDDALLGLVFRTFASAFPEVQVWWLDAGNVVLLGSSHPILIDRARARRLLDGPFAVERVRWGRLPDSDELFARFLLGTRGVHELAGRGAIHTDDRPLLELEAPRGVYRGYGQMAERLLRAKRELGALSAPAAGEPPAPEALFLGIAEMQRIAGDLPGALATLRSADPDGTNAAVLLRAGAVALEAQRVPAAHALLDAASRRMAGGPGVPALRREAAYLEARLAARDARTDDALAAFARTGELAGRAGVETLDALVSAGREGRALEVAARLLASARLGSDLGGDDVVEIYGELRRLGGLGAGASARAAAVVASSPSGVFSRCARLEALAVLYGAADRPGDALEAAREFERSGGFEPAVMKVEAEALRALSRSREAARLEARIAELTRPLAARRNRA